VDGSHPARGARIQKRVKTLIKPSQDRMKSDGSTQFLGSQNTRFRE
jgi:hypothetical protein